VMNAVISVELTTLTLLALTPKPVMNMDAPGSS